ncbi:hypothetical protein EXIGLDRAFT_729451 [Exidia glandulosa HHB12029]|uniref:Uncharacterized protein n=1 Tax=Exidia glandulosa HHB12029 TaxID=1314781 RepID=A0A165LJR5_EXIGL|nr:hypothetical protein EXIGLDRAFT_729451 [Exidia glandulosa HHB12029]
MQAIVRVPRTLALPVTADVHFPDAPDRETLQFSLAVDQDSRSIAKLGIAHDSDASFRITYDFGLGVATATFPPTASTGILNATFTTTEMRVAQSELVFIPDPSGDALRCSAAASLSCGW